MLTESCCIQCFPQIFLRFSTKRVDILLYWSLEQEGNLRDDWNMLSKRVQSHIESVKLADFEYRSNLRFEYTKKCLNDGRLACSCPSDNAYFFSFSCCNWDSFQDKRESLSIPGWKVFELKRRVFWPLLMDILVLFCCFYLLSKSYLVIVRCSKCFFCFKLLKL